MAVTDKKEINVWFRLVYAVKCHFKQYFSYIVVVSFIGGRKRAQRMVVSFISGRKEHA
jgi:hypothetical protein